MKMLVWNYDIKKEEICQIAERAFADLKITADVTPTLTRLIGQTGAGKSTRLLPKAIKDNTNGAVIIAVRNFVKYHPQRLTDREKTNGFALKILTEVLCKLIKAKANIILDMTFLSADYEKKIYALLKENGYRQKYLIRAVRKTQSDLFIIQREKETGRIVSGISKKYFYKWLRPALQFYQNEECIMWTAFKEEPIFMGKIKDGLKTFDRYTTTSG
jgi:hypothetical protein